MNNISCFFRIVLLILTLISCKEDTSHVELIKGQIDYDGLKREYIYFAPESLPKNAPLIVVMHGFTSSAAKIMEYSAINKLAKEKGFAVVYPQGSKDKKGNTFWNVGYDFHKDITIDDTGYIIHLAKYLQQKYALSAKNTFVTGMSNGGEMCYLLLCTYPDFFKAAAPVAGTMMQSFFDICEEPPSVPLLAIVGLNDKTTNYMGDIENKDGWGAYQSIPFIIDFWAKAISYSNVESDTLPNSIETDSSFVVLETYSNTNTDNKEVLFYKVVGGGHDWPGVRGNMDLNASKEIMAFFEKQLD